MIELIFAIVIIAISVVSLPVLIQATSKGVENNFIQEAIFAASAELNQALSYKWDRYSQENFGELSKIVNTQAQNCAAREGLVHRMCCNNQTAKASLIAGVDNESQSDYNINNAATTNEALFTPNTSPTRSSGYKSDYNMSVTVTFANFDSTHATGENMKKVEVSIKKDGANQVVLRAFSANIGETQAAKKIF